MFPHLGRESASVPCLVVVVFGVAVWLRNDMQQRLLCCSVLHRFQGCGEFHALLLALLQTSSFKSTTHQAHGV